MTKSRLTPALLLAAAIPMLSSCSEDFPPLNQVEGLRVLAIQSDPPAVAPEQTATISALLHTDDGAPVAYKWSWCPVLGLPEDGYACLVDEAQMKAALELIDPSAADSLPSFDLGSEPTASFTLDLDAGALRLLCEALLGQAAASLGFEAECGEAIPASIILEVTSGKDKVVAMKTIGLLQTAEAQPRNPSLLGVKARLAGDTSWTSLDEAEPATLRPGERYELEVEVPSDAAETFTPAPSDQKPEPQPEKERLFIVWFVTAGSTDSVRTTFIDGEVGLDVLTHNEWSLPTVDPPSQATLYLVIQDQRGGVAWIERTVLIEE